MVMRETFTASREEWLALRRPNIGGSDVAALFDSQPSYALSHWALWHVKAGLITAPEVSGERPKWGLRLEDAIMQGASEEFGLPRYRHAGYLQHPTVERFGCTPDFFILDGDGKPTIIVETKNADWLVHRRQWYSEPPLHIMLQVQVQLACSGLDAAWVVALVGGNRLERYEIKRRPTIIAEIERRVTSFWCSIKNNTPPPVDGSDSTSRAIASLYPNDNGEFVDMSSDTVLSGLCAELVCSASLRRKYEKQEQATKNSILSRVGAARAVKCAGFMVSATTVESIPERVAREGDVLSGRKGYRKLNVKACT